MKISLKNKGKIDIFRHRKAETTTTTLELKEMSKEFLQTDNIRVKHG